MGNLYQVINNNIPISNVKQHSNKEVYCENTYYFKFLIIYYQNNRIRQYKKVCNTKIPKQLEEYVDEEKLEKTKAYQKDNYIFSFITDALDLVETILMFV